MIRLDDLPPDPGGDLCNEVTDEGRDGFAPAMAAVGQQRLLWLPDVLTDYGCRVVTVEGWETRSRPASSGGFQPMGVLAHHTATTTSTTRPAPTLGTLVNGRSDLPGPLCHISTGYDGIVRVVAAGRANHAGVCKAMGAIPAGDGNLLYIGNEIDYNGTQPMSAAQFDAAAKAHAAILAHLGKDTRFLARHADTSVTGKWDNGGYTTTQMRAAATITPGGEVDVSADEVWAWKAREFIDEDGDTVRDERAASDILFSAHRHAVEANRKADRAAADLAAVKLQLGNVAAAVAKVQAPPVLDIDTLAANVAARIGPAIGATIEQAIAEGITRRLAE